MIYQKGGVNVRPRVVAIVPAAGRGKRLGPSKTKKPFVRLGSKPLITYALSVLENSSVIDAIIIAAEKPCVKKIKGIVSKFKFKKVVGVVIGGKTRFESIRNCLEKVGPEFDIVLIHDGARPFLEESIIKDSIKMAEKYGACVVAVPESDTIKLVDKNLFIKKTLDRNKIFRAQTPQTFKREIIQKAYGTRLGREITDDANLIEILGGKIKVLKGTYRNIKITTKEDRKMAEVLL